MCSLNKIEQTLTTKPKKIAGAAILLKLIPQDFIAVISLELDKRPKVKSVAKSVDIGNVHIIMPGKPSIKIFTTADTDAPYSVMYRAIRNNVPEPINTAVNAQIANTNAYKTSLNMYKSKILRRNESRSISRE